MKTLYEEAGGQRRLLQMTGLFYKRAVKDPVLSRLFAEVSPDHADYLADWMATQFGGPLDYLQQRGGLRFVIYKHLGLKITNVERERWAKLMIEAANSVQMTPVFMAPFMQFVFAITHSVQRHSRIEPDQLREQLGLSPGEVLSPKNEKYE